MSHEAACLTFPPLHLLCSLKTPSGRMGFTHFTKCWRLQRPAVNSVLNGVDVWFVFSYNLVFQWIREKIVRKKKHLKSNDIVIWTKCLGFYTVTFLKLNSSWDLGSRIFIFPHTAVTPAARCSPTGVSLVPGSRSGWVQLHVKLCRPPMLASLRQSHTMFQLYLRRLFFRAGGLLS